MASVDRLNEVLDYYSLWFEWITRIVPSAKEQTKFDKMNKREQYNYLKEKVNGK